MKKYSKILKEYISNKTNRQLGRVFLDETKLNILLSETSFIKHDRVTIMERVWYVRNDIHEQVKCPTCKKPTKYNYKRDKITFCSISCSANYIDEKSNLKTSELRARKTAETMRKKQPDGLTKYQEIGLKVKETLSKINPETGLTKYQERGLKAKETLSKINPETGLTKYQERGLKAKETLSKVNPETGLTGHQEKGLKSKESNSKINQKTGLTKYQEIGLKAKETLSKVNPETGLSGYQENGVKIKESNSKINPGTGLTKYQEIGLKAKETLSKINPKTGLTGHQENGLKIKETLSKINPETGETIAKFRGNLLSNKKLKEHFYILKAKFNHDYTLITSLEEYLKSPFIKYQHSCGEIRISHKQNNIRCLKCYPYNKSIAENEILEYCNSLTDNVISNDRQLIKPLEIDIVLPDFNLAIEYDGLFWHSSYSIETEAPEYHLSKTQQCMENGYQLFHIFENEWEDVKKQDIWKSIISNKLGQSERIYARKCEIRNVDTKEVKTFLETNHLQGYVPSSINLGLFYQDELISLMTFSKSRYGKNYDWELLRFCNKKYITVIGGASKLFKNFTKSNKGIVVSYADMRRSNGNLYDKLGFELSHVSEPNYWYWDKKNGLLLESRIKYQKHKLSSILEEYDVKLSESENMYNNGYRKIFDCGNQVWTFKN